MRLQLYLPALPVGGEGCSKHRVSDVLGVELLHIVVRREPYRLIVEPDAVRGPAVGAVRQHLVEQRSVGRQADNVGIVLKAGH
ncbi:hypothetical protein D3C71_1811460 [compost metagenome]